MENKQEDYIISIDGKQTVDDNSDKLSLMTHGSFTKKDGKFYIGYSESETTGFAGHYTTLEVEDQNKVTLQRIGKIGSELVIEKGKKHLCHYFTDYGEMLVGIRGQLIENSLSDNGGSLKLRYNLDINANEISVNELNITVTERKFNS